MAVDRAAGTGGQSDLNFPDTNIGAYLLQEKIGTGSFSEIWKASTAEPKDGLDVVAIKVCNKTNLGDENISRLENECLIHSRLEHPNIVKLYEVFEAEKRVFLVMEFASKGDVSHPQDTLAFLVKLVKLIFLHLTAPESRQYPWSLS
jgi:serine/threonine protein kinase